MLRLRIKQWFDPAAVPRQKQRTRLHLPDGKGKNAVAHSHTPCAPFRKGVQQDLCIRMAHKAVTAALQGGAQLRRVVQLAVVDKDIAFALPVQLHRLQAVF